MSTTQQQQLITEISTEISENICNAYGEGLEEEDLTELKTWTDEMIQEVLNRRLDSLQLQMLQKLESIEKRLIEQPQTTAVTVVKAASQSNNYWGRYQKAWIRWKKSKNEPVPIHNGDRTKEVKVDYQRFKNWSKEDKDIFIAKWLA